MSATPRVLLVGAGAIGQVFGWFLQSAGCELSFFVKEKHADEARRGFTLYELGAFRREPSPRALSGFGVLTSVEQVASQPWDHVWLCVSSTALRTGSWVEALAQATPEATWIMLQPGIEDRDWLLKRVDPTRLVCGMVPFLSFHAPLSPREPVPQPGTAFWLPPLARGPFSGPEGRLEDVVRVLRAGGYPARRHRDVPGASATPTALLTAFVTGLESAGWSFKAFLEPEPLARTLRLARETVRIAAWRSQGQGPRLVSRVSPWMIELLVPLASWLAPFELETYLQVHFTKVADQSRMFLREYLALGTQAGLPVDELRAVSSA